MRVTVDSLPQWSSTSARSSRAAPHSSCRRTASINLGVGAPDGVANVANEEKVTPQLIMTTEAGAVGGVLAGGSSFGSSANAHSILDQNQMFDFYHGGGLDLTCLGMAECDSSATSTPASSAASSTAAAASSTSRRTRARWCSPERSRRAASRSRSRTASCSIVKEGRAKKFVQAGRADDVLRPVCGAKPQPVIYVTERCVFQLTHDGLELIEVAPGIDIERDILAHMAFKPNIHKPRADGRAHLPRRADGAAGGPD